MNTVFSELGMYHIYCKFTQNHKNPPDIDVAHEEKSLKLSGLILGGT